MARLFCASLVVMFLVILVNQATSKVPPGHRGGSRGGRGGSRGSPPDGGDGHSGSSPDGDDGHSDSAQDGGDGHSTSSADGGDGHWGSPPGWVGGGRQGASGGSRGGRRGGGGRGGGIKNDDDVDDGDWGSPPDGRDGDRGGPPGGANGRSRGGHQGGRGRGGGNNNDDESETTSRKTTAAATTTQAPLPPTTQKADEPYAPVSGCLLPTTETGWNCPEFIVGPAGTYHKHENCLYFCQCGAADALPTVQTCPNGTVWSPNINSCDYAGYLTCQSVRIVDCLPTDQTAWDCQALLDNGVNYAAALPDPRFYCQCGSDRPEPHIVQCSAGTVWKQTDGQTFGGCVHDTGK